MLSSNLKKQKAEKKLAEQQKNDLILNKLMLFFVIGVIGIFGMLTAARNLPTEAKFRVYVLPVLLVFAGIAFVASIVYFAIQRSRHVDESNRILTSLNLLGTAAVFFGSSVYYKLAFDATQVVIILICAVVLYFVYNIFRKDFFMCSAITAAELVLIKISAGSTSTTIGILLTSVSMALAIIIPILGILLAILLHLNKGILSLGTTKMKLIEKGDHIYPMLVVSGISLIGAILTIVTSAAAVYSILALLVVYLAIAVAYTIRMM